MTSVVTSLKGFGICKYGRLPWHLDDLSGWDHLRPWNFITFERVGWVGGGAVITFEGGFYMLPLASQALSWAIERGLGGVLWSCLSVAFEWSPRGNTWLDSMSILNLWGKGHARHSHRWGHKRCTNLSAWQPNDISLATLSHGPSFEAWAGVTHCRTQPTNSTELVLNASRSLGLKKLGFGWLGDATSPWISGIHIKYWEIINAVIDQLSPGLNKITKQPKLPGSPSRQILSPPAILTRLAVIQTSSFGSKSATNLSVWRSKCECAHHPGKPHWKCPGFLLRSDVMLI